MPALGVEKRGEKKYLKSYFHVFNMADEGVVAVIGIFYFHYNRTNLSKEKVTYIIFLSFELDFKEMNAVVYVPSVHWLILKLYLETGGNDLVVWGRGEGSI